MALNDQLFISKIIALQSQMSDETDTAQASQKYAQDLLQAIKTYLMSGTVIITGTSNQGPFTGTGTIT